MGKNVYCYGRDTWNLISQPGGVIGELASDGYSLYALVFPDGNPLRSSVIKRYNRASNSWDEGISAYNYSIQSIYGVGGKIFAGGQHNLDYQYYVILYLDSTFFTAIKYRVSLLTGAVQSASGDIYLATAGSGIYRFHGNTIDNDPVANTVNANIAGIIETGGTIIAVNSNGTIYTLNTPGSFNSFSIGVDFTGAMGIWKEYDRGSWKPSLLLLGIRGRGTSLSHGYRELVLEKNSGRPTYTINNPGDASPTSVKSKPKYAASIGIHPVEAILQVPEQVMGYYQNNPEWEPIIFASTSRSGLWSYRDGQWNAEE
jgi:hypothetical protein